MTAPSVNFREKEWSAPNADTRWPAADTRTRAGRERKTRGEGLFGQLDFLGTGKWVGGCGGWRGAGKIRNYEKCHSNSKTIRWVRDGLRIANAAVLRTPNERGIPISLTFAESAALCLRLVCVSLARLHGDLLHSKRAGERGGRESVP